ncbi:MAG TPA: esterase-like activity of phytase family protein [Thermoanaerobaculia bacterium]|nr:esterase-like activity of phytase family protein [Thermoanaerobaculia bacterium]
MTRRTLSALAASLFVAACAQNAPPPPGEPSPPRDVRLVLLGKGPLVIPNRTQVDGLRAGGLSGIVRAPDGTWLAVVDNEGETPARVFRLGFTVGEDGVSRDRQERRVVREAILLKGLNGKTFDGEGIALVPSETSGNLLVSSEIEPSIREFSLAGKLLATLPVPAPFLAGKGRGVRGNQGFESLTLEPGGAVLWTANERALQQDAPDDPAKPSPVRLLRYERRGEGFAPAAQYVYEVDAIDRPPAEGFKIRGLAELLAIPGGIGGAGGGLLALEREYVVGRGMTIQLFLVSLAGATDVSGLDSLAGQSFTPVRKTLVYDFAGAGFLPDNIEGMAWGPPLPDGSPTLVLVSDNNFELLQQTQIMALRWIE